MWVMTTGALRSASPETGRSQEGFANERSLTETAVLIKSARPELEVRSAHGPQVVRRSRTVVHFSVWSEFTDGGLAMALPANHCRLTMIHAGETERWTI